MNLPSRRNKLKIFLLISIVANACWIYKSYSFSSSTNEARFANSSRHTNKDTASKSSNVTLQTNGENHETLQPKKDCEEPKTLAGPLRIDFREMKESFQNLNNTYSKILKRSTLFEPQHCKAKSSVAIIIPFRDREEHLQLLLGHLFPIVQRQLLRYQIFVIEQAGNTTFNKGRIMNTGFQFLKQKFDIPFDCYIFHDVDMLPENDNNIYRCGTRNVRHLSCSLDKFKYHPLCCGMTVGGVLAFTEEQFSKVNGFPNDYWGWGGEDDDMNARIKMNKLSVERPNNSLCRYTMINHERDALNTYVDDTVNKRVSNAKLMAKETGLNDLNTTIIKHERRPLYMHLLVDVGIPP